MIDRLTSMAVFVRVASKGSFAAAADGLSMTPAMVGKHIRFLEDRIGGALLSRTTRRQSLTDAGRIFLERARSILAEVDLAEGLLDDTRTIPRGMLRLSAPVSLGEKLAPALVDYSALYPEVSVELVLNNGIVDLAGDGYDVAFRTGRLAISDLIARPLTPYRFVLCAAPSYLAKFGPLQSPVELQHHRCLTFTGWEDGNLWTFSRADGETCQVPIQSYMRMNDRFALRAAAIAGGGILLQSRPAIASAIDEGRLVRLLPEWEPPIRSLHLVWLRDRHPTQKLRTFIDFAVSRFGSDTPAN